MLLAKDVSKLTGIHTTTIIIYENNASYPCPELIININALFDNEVVCDEYSQFIISDYVSKLENIRLANKYSKNQFVELLNVSFNAYASWINKKTYINKETYEKIKNKLKN